MLEKTKNASICTKFNDEKMHQSRREIKIKMMVVRDMIFQVAFFGRKK